MNAMRITRKRIWVMGAKDLVKPAKDNSSNRRYHKRGELMAMCREEAERGKPQFVRSNDLVGCSCQVTIALTLPAR